MNRTKIEWTDFSWNPITGCKHGCWYCYAKKLTQRFKNIFPYGFEPHFYPERLKEPWEYKKPSKIFVCSIADLFAKWTPDLWREQVFDSMIWCLVKHTFQMLTKNPENISDAEFPDNFWFGVTVSTQEEFWRIDEIRKVNVKTRFVSFEPLLGFIDFHTSCLKDIQWVIIGKLTGSKKIKLEWEWVVEILNEAKRHNIPVFMKNNLGCAFPIQEFPQVN